MRRFAILSLLGLLLLPGQAPASTASTDGVIITITGGPENNQISVGTGIDATGIRDVAGITAGPGCTQSDPTSVTCGTISGHRVDADLGAGADRIEGTAGRFGIVSGGPGDDEIRAGEDGNQLFGDAGDDLIDGGAGNDNIVGGTGVDRLLGDGAEVDAGGPDAFNSRDGERDDVYCSVGYDFVTADWLDRVDAECERVNRGPRPQDPPPPPGEPPPPGATTPDLPKMTLATARSAARRYLGRRFRAWRKGSRRSLGRARRSSRTSVKLSPVSVRYRDRTYRGWVRAEYVAGGDEPRVRLSGALRRR